MSNKKTYFITGGGTKDAVINRNEETTLDIGDLEVAEAKYVNAVLGTTVSYLLL